MPEIIAGKYEVLEVIGRGGMGTVYKALQRNLDRIVAIKMLSEELAADPEFRARFQQEATIIARLNHPNIVAVHDIEPHNHTFCIIMEYLEGETLQARIDRDVVLPEREALSIGAQVARALHYAHEHGIVHRDVKPDNIHISPQGVAKVMDFGIARFLQSKLKTQTGISMGTPKFMSPEQVTGKNVDGQTDLYSLGICLYMALTGRVPFDGENAIAIATRHLYEPPEPPSRINPSITPAAEKVVLRALEKAKGDRFRDGSDMAAAIEAALATRTPLRLDREDQPFYAGATQKMNAVSEREIASRAAGASALETPGREGAVAVSTPTGLHRLSDAAAREHQAAREYVRASTISASNLPRLEEEDFAGARDDLDEEGPGEFRPGRFLRRLWPLAVAFLLILSAVAYLIFGSRNHGIPLDLQGNSMPESTAARLARLRAETEQLLRSGHVVEAWKGWTDFEKQHGETTETRTQTEWLENRLPLTLTRELAMRRERKAKQFIEEKEAQRPALAYAYLKAAVELKDKDYPSLISRSLLNGLLKQTLDSARPAEEVEAELRRAEMAVDPKRREQHLLNAASYAPQDWNPWLRLGNFYRDQGDWDDARVAYSYAASVASGADLETVRKAQQELEERAQN